MQILFVEDFAPLREALVRGVAREGFQSIECEDGRAGLDCALEMSPNLIVLDAMLPGIDGFEFLRRYRSEGKTTPVLMLTARDALEDRIAGFDAGADDYLTKPFAYLEFMARIRSLLRRGRESRTYTLKDLEIDTERRSAKRGGREIPLTPREFSVLELLLREQGKPVPRDEIRRRIYTGTEESSSNVVEVFVGNLRRKLEEGGRTRLLHTRRGFGYVLQEDPP